MLSIIVPAHNEADHIEATLTHLHEAARQAGVAYELIVVDDASEDATAERSRELGAQVCGVAHRHIAATRNAGARIARFHRFLFVDADTLVPPETLAAAMAAMDDGAVGGGAQVAFSGEPPRSARIGLWCWNRTARLCRWAAGCFVFARRDAFETAGGFDETYFAGEELALSRGLKRCGRFVVLRQCVHTSPRKFHLYRISGYLKLLGLTLLTGGRVLRRREHLPQWYNRQRVD